MTPFPYRVIVRWSAVDEAYVAEVPAVIGAGGDGPTEEEALRAAKESVNELLEVKREHGDPLPPSDLEQPVYSGQLRVRMSRSLHGELAAAAEREGVSLNQLIVTCLARAVGRAQALAEKGAPAFAVGVTASNCSGLFSTNYDSLLASHGARLAVSFNEHAKFGFFGLTAEALTPVASTPTPGIFTPRAFAPGSYCPGSASALLEQDAPPRKTEEPARAEAARK